MIIDQLNNSYQSPSEAKIHHRQSYSEISFLEFDAMTRRPHNLFKCNQLATFLNLPLFQKIHFVQYLNMVISFIKLNRNSFFIQTMHTFLINHKNVHRLRAFQKKKFNLKKYCFIYS